MAQPEQPNNLRSREAAVRVNQFRSSRMVFQRNYEEFVTFLDYFCAPSVAFSFSPVDQRWLWREGVNEIARLLHNFVAAALSLVDHTRVLYRQLYEPHGELTEYPEKVTESLAHDPVVQFVIKLRQMAQHYRLPSLHYETEISDISDGVAGTVRIWLSLKTEDLQQFDGWNAPAKAYISQAASSVNLRSVVTEYQARVTRFYEWFEQRQRDVHGIGPDLLNHILVHGPSVGPRLEVGELAEGVAALERKPKSEITFADLEAAFEPVLSIVDTRRLLLCRHDGRTWVEVALLAAQSRFTIPPELGARIRALV